MRIDLDANEIHWLKYCLLISMHQLPPWNTEVKTTYQGILTKLEDNHCIGLELTSEQGFGLNQAQQWGSYRVDPTGQIERGD